VTEIVQLAPDGTTVPHVFDTRKSAAFVPVIVIPETERNAVPVFVNVIVCTVLRVFTVCEPKFRLPGLITTCGVLTLALASGVHVFVAVHPYKLEPGAAVVLKNNCPTSHVDGSDAPTETGRVDG
jgi:hypothetical protein